MNFETSTGSSNQYLVLGGQQRFTSLFAAFNGTYNNKQMSIDVLSGTAEGKDPGNQYYDCQFLSKADAVSLTENGASPRRHYMPIRELK